MRSFDLQNIYRQKKDQHQFLTHIFLENCEKELLHKVLIVRLQYSVTMISFEPLFDHLVDSSIPQQCFNLGKAEALTDFGLDVGGCTEDVKNEIIKLRKNFTLSVRHLTSYCGMYELVSKEEAKKNIVTTLKEGLKASQRLIDLLKN